MIFIKKWKIIKNSISLSKHHYIDEINDEIFGVKTVTFKEVSESLPSTHLTCNLIKGYIDDIKSAKEYLDACLSYNLTDVGFTTLMDANDYCKENKIKFVDIFNHNLEENNIIKIGEWNNFESCRCGNYSYVSDKYEKVVNFFAKHYCVSNNNESNMVYDGQFLTQGFNGEIII
jgi:hypothetical protein